MPIATKTRLTKYVNETKRKRELEMQLKDCKAKLAEIEPEIIEQFQNEGVQSINIDGYTVYLNRKLWAGPVEGDKEGMYEALRGCDDETWSFLVEPTVNSMRLTARVRECEQDAATGMPILPAELVGKVAIQEQFKVGRTEELIDNRIGRETLTMT